MNVMIAQVREQQMYPSFRTSTNIFPHKFPHNKKIIISDKFKKWQLGTMMDNTLHVTSAKAVTR